MEVQPVGKRHYSNVAILDTLRNCSVSVPAICDSTKIVDFNENVLQKVKACIDPLNRVGSDYKFSFKKNPQKITLFFISKSSSFMQRMMQEMYITKFYSIQHHFQLHSSDELMW